MTLTIDSDTDQIGAGLAEVAAGVAGLVEAPVWSLTDELVQQRLTEVLRAVAGLEELATRLVSEVDTRGLATLAGCASTSAWLASTQRMSRGRAAATVALAKAMTVRSETTRQAWAEGQLNAEQATVIATAINRLAADLPLESIRQAQVDLVSHAQTLSLVQLSHLANHLVELIDPDSVDAHLAAQLEAEEKRALEATQFRLSRIGDGTHRITGRLPDLHAAMLRTALEAYAAPRRQAAAKPGAPSGDGVSPVFDVDGDHSSGEVGNLTQRQRFGRALCEMLEHLPTDKLPSHGVSNASIVVTLDHDHLINGLGEALLDTGGVVSAGQARRLACNAGLVPIVLDGPSRVLDLGLSKRLFDRHQRLALAVRDQGCVWPGCDRPPSWCEAHHLTAFSRAGPTDLANGCLLCGFHHRLLHDGRAGWAIVLAADGTPELIPPARIDPAQQPQRHQRFTARHGP